MPGNGKVFVSHTHADNERCEPLLAALDAWGVDYWFDAQQLDAGQQLTPRLQEAITQRDVLLRVCTLNTPGSYWMNLELSAFRAVQYQERKQRPEQRTCIDLTLDESFTPGQLERAEVTIATANKPQHIWLEQLARALNVSRGVRRQRAVSRRAVVGLGGAAALSVASLVGGAAIIKTRNDAAAAPYPKPKVIPFTNPQTLDKRIKWYFKSGDELGSGIAIAGNTLLACSDDGLFALNASDGSILWSETSIRGNASSTPVVAGSRFYIAAPAGLSGNLIAIDIATGAQVWKVSTTSTLGDTNFAVVNTAIYMLTDENFVVSFNTRDGSKRWQTSIRIPSDGLGDHAPASDGMSVFIGGVDGNLYAFSAVDGSLRWKYQTGGNIASTVAVANGVVYFGSKDQNVYAVDAATGAPVWRFAANTDIGNTPYVAGAALYFGANDKLVALDKHTGAQLWQAAAADPSGVNNFISGPVTVSGDVIYAPADAYLYAFSAQKHAMLWRFQSSANDTNLEPPVVAGSTAYWAAYNHTIYALDTSPTV